MQPIGLLTLNAQPDELLRRDRAGRLPRRPPGARHRRHRRPAAAGPAVLLPRHPADPARRPQLRADPDQPPARAGQRHAPRRLPPARRARGRRAVPAELARRRLPVPRRRRPRARSSTCRSGSPRPPKVRAQPGVVRRPLQPGAAVLAEHDAGRAGAHRRGVHLRARQVLRAGDQGAPAAGAGEHRPGAVPAGRDRARPARPGADRRRSPTPRPSPALSQVGGDLAARRPDRRHRGRPRRRPRAACAGAADAVLRRRHGAAGDRAARRARVDGIPVQRTFADRRGPSSSTRCCSPAPRSRARTPLPARDAKAGAAAPRRVDPRVLLLVEEAFRHAKAIGAWGAGVAVLDAAGAHRRRPASSSGDDATRRARRGAGG